MNDNAEQPTPTHQSQDLLPPVQPPDARFLMQLFVTPLVIVAVIVGVFFLVSWMARPEQQPAALVDGIERLDHRSWRQALALANQLRDNRFRELRCDPELASRLAGVLERQMQNKVPSDERVRLQVYLCRALGEFETDVVVPTLVDAASPQPAWKPMEVRRAALQGLGMLASQLGGEAIFETEQAVSLLLQMSEAGTTAEPDVDPEELARLRSTAVYVLGLVGGDAAQQRLRELLHDSEVDIRFNAATGLARHGDLRSLATLQTMLQWNPSPSEPTEVTAVNEARPISASERQQKRDLVISTALRTVAQLAADFPATDLSQFREPIGKILEDETISWSVRSEAKDVMRLLDADSVSQDVLAAPSLLILCGTWQPDRPRTELAAPPSGGESGNNDCRG